MNRQLGYWILISLFLSLPLVLWSNLPLWSIILLPPLLALLIQRGFHFLATRRNRKIASYCGHQTLAAAKLVQNQDFDLSNKPPCPHCHSEDVAKMIYGKPALTRQIIEGLESAEFIAGGCMIYGGAPEWHCNKCNRDFGHLVFDLE